MYQYRGHSQELFMKFGTSKISNEVTGVWSGEGVLPH